MKFGKNRIQYNNHYWRYKRFDKFDSYYYGRGQHLSEKVTEIAHVKIPELESFFGYGLRKRLIFISYQNLSEFRETNIGYNSGNENSNLGGKARTRKNKIFIFGEGKYERIEQQVVAGISEVLIKELLYGGSLRQKVTSSALLNLPDWYLSGLISYISSGWNFETDNLVRDYFENGKFKKIHHLTGEDARLAGHAFWFYIAETYGKDAIPNILYYTRVNKNTDSGFKYVLGSPLKELYPAWLEYLEQKYSPIKGLSTLPNKKNILIKGKREARLQEIKHSPDGKYLAYVQNKEGKYKVIIYDNEKNKKKIIRSKGHKLDQLTDYSYPVLAWHPSSKIIAFMSEHQGILKLFTYNIEKKELQSRKMFYIDKVLSFSYSKQGTKIVMSAVTGGKSNIIIFNLISGTRKYITKDWADDFNPQFIENDSKIIFSSNRTIDSTVVNDQNIAKTYDLFIFNNKTNSKKLTRITNTPYISEYSPVEYKKNTFINITDENGIYNREVIKHDSTIMSVDTIIHYRYFTIKQPITNYSRNIDYFDINKNTVYDISRKNGRYNIYSSNFNINTKNLEGTKFRTPYSLNFTGTLQKEEQNRLQKIIEDKKRQAEIDSLRKNPSPDIVHPDSTLFNVNRYVFEKEKKLKYYEVYPIIDTISKSKKDSLNVKYTNNYYTNFYTNHLVQQAGFGFLNQSYQVFTGEPFYFASELGLFTKVGVYDLFEDYRITGGFRLSADFNTAEYLFSIENLKKRLDKQYIYHRQVHTEQYNEGQYYYYYMKIFTNEMMFIGKYPFNQVAAVRGTFNIRYDKAAFLSRDHVTLAAPNQHQVFAGAKLEYIFDNTFDLGLNLYEGTRFKLFTEFYQEADQDYTNLFTIGADFRYYKKIHRTLIFASRMAASASLGRSKLIYYLGGVDNWYSFSTENKSFDYSVDINENENYVYQAVATNMRGFIQNARNGTNFVVWNNEIRFPVIRYFANRPIHSDFWNNLQLIAFADAGSAWSGISPYDPKNAYRTETVTNGPISIVIDKNRSPVVLGYGWGVRSRLFGYFFRLDWAWGVDNDIILPRMFYFSLDLDF